MNQLISGVISRIIAKIISFFQGLRLKPLAAVILGSWLLFATDVSAAQNTHPSADEIVQRLRQHDQDSERPKTSGEFLEEARGDVPLNDRIYNITRDSKEAFGELGENISQSAKENVRGVKESAKNISQGAESRVENTLN